MTSNVERVPENIHEYSPELDTNEETKDTF